MADTPIDPPQLHTGDVVVGKYRVDRVLGAGGMGMVVAATHDQLGQKVALKFLLPTVAARPDLVERFLREARAAVRIQSEHVARVFDVGTHGASPFMVMEYLEGSDLAEVIASRGPLAIREAVGYLLEACDAVAEAHSLGIVHRDLKPANLYLANRPSGRPVVKVLDFGISKSPVTDKEAAITNATAIMGSPSYMSPEQMVAAASVDVRSDIWSLGVVLYEMLAKRVPFLAESMPELVGIILQGTFPPLAAMRPDLAGDPALAEMQAIIDRCLQKDRAHRFQNVGELARALVPFGPSRSEALAERIESVLGLSSGVPSSARPASATQRSQPGAPASPASMTFAPTTTAPPRKRSPAVVILPVIALVSVVAIGIGVFVESRARVVPAAPLGITSNVIPLVSTSSPVIIAPDTTTTTTTTTTPVTTDTNSAQTVIHVKPHASGHASATPSTAPSASGSGCHTVSSYDDKGDVHFKVVCPP